MNKILTIAALALSAASLALSTWTYSQADARAERALQERERRLVEKWKPGITEACLEFDAVPAEDPQTLDELFQPFFDLVVKLSSSE
ncbi:MAG: hypothetical protein WD875_16345 [Pirellulales bacterium]